MEAWNNTVAAGWVWGGLFLHVLLGVLRRDVEMVSGMGWGVVISCFCEMGEVDTEPCCAVMFFCFSPLEWDGLWNTRNRRYTPTHSKKQAEHSVMKTVTKNAVWPRWTAQVSVWDDALAALFWVRGLQKGDFSSFLSALQFLYLGLFLLMFTFVFFLMTHEHRCVFWHQPRFFFLCASSQKNTRTWVFQEKVKQF